MAHVEIDRVAVWICQLTHMTKFNTFDVNVVKPVFDLGGRIKNQA